MSLVGQSFCSIMWRSPVCACTRLSFQTAASSGIRVISMGKMTKRNMTILALAIAVGIGGNYSQAYLSFLPSTVVTLITDISGTALTALILNFVLPKSAEDRADEAEQARIRAQQEADAERKAAEAEARHKAVRTA